MNTEYEMVMASKIVPGGDGKCTGVSSIEAKEGYRQIFSGQTNDEHRDGFLSGQSDQVVRMKADLQEGPLGLTLYKHAGYGAYMGINSHGVSVTWQYVDDGRRDLDNGVPTNILILEALTKRTAKEAVAYLRSVPWMVPNNYIVTGPDGAYDLEGAPGVPGGKPDVEVRFCNRNALVHANHSIQHAEMYNNEHSTSKTTHARQAAAEALMARQQGRTTLCGMMNLFSTPPILNDNTLVRLVFQHHTKGAPPDLLNGMWAALLREGKPVFRFYPTPDAAS